MSIMHEKILTNHTPLTLTICFELY